MEATGKGMIIRRIADDMATIDGFEYADETWPVHCAYVDWVIVVDLGLPLGGSAALFRDRVQDLGGTNDRDSREQRMTRDAEDCVLCRR